MRSASSTARRSCSIRATATCSAFTSRPAYDPNAFSSGIDRATWAALTTDEDRPLNDRAIQGRYSPGSTFKMAVALAGTRRRHHHARLSRVLPRTRDLLRPHVRVLDRSGGHGSMDLRHAIEQSCNVYFYTVGQHGRRRQDPQVGDAARAWREERHRPAERGRRGSCRPPSGSGASRTRSGTPAKRFRSAIGQGAVAVTPVSMAVYMATLANGGTRVTPHLLKAVDDGQRLEADAAPPPQSTVDIEPEKIQAIRDGLWMVVNGGGHRAQRADHRLRRLRARPEPRR